MRTRTSHLGLSALTTAALLIGACGTADDSADGFVVLATTTVLGDIASNVAGPEATVITLLPPGVDPHDYVPSAREVAQLQSADLVIANGLGLEEGLTDVLDAARSDGVNVLEVAPNLSPLRLAQSGRESGTHDPHVWLDPLRMAQAGRLIAERLTAISPGDWETRAEVYAAELKAADDKIIATLAVVPADGRKLVTNHDSLGYFADRYNFAIIGVVIPGGSTLAEPSAADLAALVETMAAAGSTTIFAETTDPSVLAEAVAAEAGNRVVVIELHTGSLGGPDSGANSLIDMLVSNAFRIAAALSP